MTILLVRPDGGAMEPFDVPAGTTVGDLLAAIAPDRDPVDFEARVNRLPASPGHVLRPDDRVSLTPIRDDSPAD